MSEELPKTNIMLGRLGIVYGQPCKSDNESVKFHAEYARILRHYTDAELNDAADKLLVERKFKTWPTVAECVAACEVARAARRSAMVAQENQTRIALLQQPKPISAAEQVEAERFVDGVADGSIPLFEQQIAEQKARTHRGRGGIRKIGDVVDFSLMSTQLRRMAQHMSTRRKAKEGSE